MVDTASAQYGPLYRHLVAASVPQGSPERGDVSPLSADSDNSIQSKRRVPALEVDLYNNRAIAEMFHELRSSMAEVRDEVRKVKLTIDALKEKLVGRLNDLNGSVADSFYSLKQDLHQMYEGIGQDCKRIQSAIALGNEIEIACRPVHTQQGVNNSTTT